MKHPILAVALCCFAAVATAQPASPRTGPWREVNIQAVGGGTFTQPNYAIAQIVALSPTFAWAIGYDATSPLPAPPRNVSMRTINAAGTEFDFNPIQGTVSFQPVNISVPAGVPGNLTAFCGQYNSGATTQGGSEVIRTTDGGAAWHRITNNQVFASPASFCNWVYAFDANAAVMGGDPSPVPGPGPGTFELWYTTNASAPAATAVAWTRATAPLALDADEYLMPGIYAAVGNTLWAATMHQSSTGPIGTCRVLRSTDQGHTWTAHNTPMVGEIQHIAFKDALHGLAFTATASRTELMTTADGGLSWTLQTLPDPATADTVRGKFYRFGVSAIPGLGFMSYGDAIPGSRRLVNRGASFSCEGIGKSWTDVDKARSSYISASFLQTGPRGYTGYLGGYTKPNTLTIPYLDPGGFYQVTAGATAPACLLPTRSATAGPPLQATPNPSPDGVFQLALPAGLGTGAEVTVCDALGRVVLRRALAERAAGSFRLDLSQQRPGVYTLRVSSSTGTAVQKLVAE